ncbi:methyltransferase-like protein 25B isoform X2 [Daphnia pulicaria]|nr:methyltransferase-like protein 25B isoform X2 [Daphnia pulicaria]
MGECLLSQSGTSKTNSLVLPLSLLAFKAACKALSLDRTAISSLDEIISYLNKLGFKSATLQHCEWMSPNSACKPKGALRSLSQVFHRQVKPKKQHELYRMGQCCAMISQVTKCQTVADVGAGVGHLSRFLSYGHGLDVICLECEEKFGSAAVKLDSKLEESCARQGITNITTPRHITLTLSPYTKNLMELLEPHIIKETSAVGLIGLHTCGDLGPTLIRNFAVDPGIKFILAIGCCYMKMSLDRTSPVRGYPMSNFVQNQLNPSFVSYEALEVACHALESYSGRLTDLESEKFKVHCYRATLETLLIKLEPPLQRAGLRSVKNAHLLPFEEYTRKALDKMDVKLDFSDLSSEHVHSCLKQWKRVVMFYSLRLMLAPVIETVVQLDRLLYLAEQGWCGCLLPLFDCRLSPRNFALLCVKPEPKSESC